jgi:hypothetical protein
MTRTSDFYAAYLGREPTPVERAAIEECDRIGALHDAQRDLWLAGLSDKERARRGLKGNAP